MKERTRTVIIAGSGPSLADFEFPDGVPIIAVSSGIWKVPEGAQVEMATVDYPRHYRADITDPWGKCALPASLVIHVPEGTAYESYTPGPGCPSPDFSLVIDQMNHGPAPFVQGWREYINVVPWRAEVYAPCLLSFDPGAVIGLDSVRQSIVFAAQVASRLTYDKVIFAGCDMGHPRYGGALAKMREMKPQADELGIEWVVSSDKSEMASFVPVEVCV